MNALFVIITLILATLGSSVVVLIAGFQAGILGFGMILILAIAFKYPRQALWALLIYLPLGGTIIYTIPGVYQPVGGQIRFSRIYPFLQLAKDGIYYPALIGAIVKGSSIKQLFNKYKPLFIALGCLLGVCLLTYFLVNISQQFQPINPNSNRREFPLLMGIFGLKVFLGYIPLILGGYYLIRNQKDLFSLTRLHIILILVCCSLCLIQYLLLVNGICNDSTAFPDPIPYRTSLQARCFVGGSLLYNPNTQIPLIRLPGTFVAPWQWGWFLIANSFFAYGSAKSDTSPIWKWLSWLAIALILIACIISGQRIALVLVPIILLTLFLVTENYQKVLAIKLGIITFLTIIITNLGMVQTRIESLISRWNYSPPPGFILKQWQRVINDYDNLFGHGLGRTASAARKLGQIRLVELFHAQLFYEIGPIGLIVFVAVIGVLIYYTWVAYRSLSNPSLKYLGLCLWAFILFIGVNIYYYPLTVDPVNVYYWFFAGVLLKLPQIESDSIKAKGEYSSISEEKTIVENNHYELGLNNEEVTIIDDDNNELTNIENNHHEQSNLYQDE